MSAPQYDVIVVGSGFGGVAAARRLARSKKSVLMISAAAQYVFQPLLYQLATCLLETTAVGHSLRDLVKDQDNATIHKAVITAIDLDAKEVRFDALAPIAYDYLVLALGAEVNFFGTEGAAEHAFPMYTLPDAVRLKNHVLDRWEASDKNVDLVDDGAREGGDLKLGMGGEAKNQQSRRQQPAHQKFTAGACWILPRSSSATSH